MAGVVLVYLLVVAFSGSEVLAQTDHVVGGDDGWSSVLKVRSWLAGRVFRVGDKIWFRYPAAEETIVELQSLDEFMSCDITNPIKMYTDGLNHVTLEKEGTRYFTSGNLENCKNGMKLPVPVQTHPCEPTPPEPFSPVHPLPPFVPTPSEPFPPVHPLPPFVPTPSEPFPPVHPLPPFVPTPPKPFPPVHPLPPFVPTPPEPLPPVHPLPPFVPAPPKPFPPVHPLPPFVPTPPEPLPPVKPPPPPHSAATAPLNVLCFVFFGLFLSYFGL